jgi:AcrR family transcriptional regulator
MPPARAAAETSTGTSNGGPAETARRRRRLGEAERRAQIVAGCVEVLAAEGYENASLARIADAAGVSKGLVSHYFTDRDTLMEQVAISTVAALREAVAAQIDPAADVLEVVTAAVHLAAGIGRTHAVQIRAIEEIVHNLRDADGRPRLDLRAYEETYRAQEQLFRRGQAEGTLRGFDTRVMAVTYQGAIDTMIAYLDAHPEADPDHHAGELAALLVAAMRAEE